MAGIEGVKRVELNPNEDERGSLTEGYREAWLPGVSVTQVNRVVSKEGAIRGMHVHKHHTDYVLMASGVIYVGLHDMREGSPTKGESEAFELTEEDDIGLVIPPGVAHGFLALVESRFFVNVNRYYDPIDDEFTVRWDDPELAIKWPIEPIIVSERDVLAGSVSDLEGMFTYEDRDDLVLR